MRWWDWLKSKLTEPSVQQTLVAAEPDLPPAPEPDPDAAAFEHYDKPENREPAPDATPIRRQGPKPKT